MNPETYQLVELILLAANGTFEAVVAYALIPERLKHNSEHRQREARIRLNLENVLPNHRQKPLFGLDQQLDSIPDIIDHLHYPERYSDLLAGNEILIFGAAQSGKKALAFEIAKRAGLNRIIIVHNPQDPDVLARAVNILEGKPPMWRRVARNLTQRLSSQEKIMLLIPGLDHVNGHTGEAWMDQLEGLIETAAVMPNVLIIATSRSFDRNGEIANWFGTALPVPALDSIKPPSSNNINGEWKRMMHEVATGYIQQAHTKGFHLSDIDEPAFIDAVLKAAINPAEIEDIVNHCQSMAIYAGWEKHSRSISPTFLEQAIRRVAPNAHNAP